MGLFDRLRRPREVRELPCPRCGIPAPEDVTECSACGWDVRDKYDGVVPGSLLTEAEPASRA